MFSPVYDAVLSQVWKGHPKAVLLALFQTAAEKELDLQ
jgi:hypothetical protein